MKLRYVVVWLTFNTIAVSAQSSVEVIAKDCRYPSSVDVPVYLPLLTLYKDGVFFEKVTLSEDAEDEDRVTIDNLITGKYRIDYWSMYGQTLSTEIDVLENSDQQVTLCLDLLDYNDELYNPFIDQLGDSDSYTIKYVTKGCFHHNEYSMTVERKDHDYYVTYKAEKKRLSGKQVDMLRHFEAELYHIEHYDKGIRSTLSENYSILYKDKELNITDHNNEWYGFGFLLRHLGLAW